MQEQLALHTAPELDTVTPQAEEVLSASASCLDLYPSPLPSLWWWGEDGGMGGKPLPSPSSLLPKENQLHLQAACAPLPCLGKGSRLGAASWVGVGAGIKTMPFFYQIPNGSGLLELKGRKERQSRNGTSRVSVGGRA